LGEINKSRHCSPATVVPTNPKQHAKHISSTQNLKSAKDPQHNSKTTIKTKYTSGF